MNRPQVGVGAIVRWRGRVLLGKRKGSHGAGEYSFPGGHLEFFESPEETAVRETLEETGLHVAPVTRGPFSDDRFPVEQKHYITLYVVADAPEDAVPHLLEPHKCEGWAWYRWDELPSPLFAGIESLLESGFDPFDVSR